MPERIDEDFKIVKSEGGNFYIWRIENFKPVAVPKENYGEFFEGDAYIVYFDDIGKTPKNAQLRNSLTNSSSKIHIHFWLGASSSNDEQGTAAIKTVELDDYLGGCSVQHREVQGHESPRFKSYFKNGMRILNGGVNSGFRHVKDDFKPRLYKIKGKRCPTLTELPSISWEHFNKGDVFILQTKKIIFVWCGKQSNHMERLQASKVAGQLRDERGGSSIVNVNDEEENILPKLERQELDKYLPLSKRVIKAAEEDIDDVKMEFNVRQKIKLYLCTDADGKFRVELIKEGAIQQSDLHSEDAFIINNNERGIWVWVGRKSTSQEKAKSMSNAQEFAKRNSYSYVPVTRVMEESEPVEFKMLFTSWREPNEATNLRQPYVIGKIAKVANKKFDAKTLHETPKLAAESQQIDNGSGNIEVWRLHNKDLEPVPENQFGLFFSSNCYLIHYTYHHKTIHHLLYYWLGTQAPQNDRGTIAWHTVKKDDELGGAAVQIRVVQNKEPPHFLSIFRGRMTVFHGGYSSIDGLPKKFLMHVRANESNQTKAVQVEYRASSLNTNDVFVLRTSKTCYVWCGKGSADLEIKRGKAIAEEWSVGKEYRVVQEGQEHSRFWKKLGGKEKYADNPRLADPSNWKPARLFHCSDATGYFKAEEIFDFSQNDLVPDDVMILDANSVVFVWVGQGSNQREKRESINMVNDYLQSDPSCRDLDTPIVIIPQGNEPPNFTGFFGIWDPELWKKSNYEIFERKHEEKQNDIISTTSKKVKVYSSQSTFSIEVLKDINTDNAPDAFDFFHKEVYLSAKDFEKVFGMTLNNFQCLPKWRQDALKKSVGLF